MRGAIGKESKGSIFIAGFDELFSSSRAPGFCSRFLRERYVKKRTRKMHRRPMTPPTTPPAIAPACDLWCVLGDDVEEPSLMHHEIYDEVSAYDIEASHAY